MESRTVGFWHLGVGIVATFLGAIQALGAFGGLPPGIGFLGLMSLFNATLVPILIGVAFIISGWYHLEG